MDRGAIVVALSRVELFRGVDDGILGHVADISREWSIPPGQHVYFAGDLATEFYVVVSGRVRAFIPGHGDERSRSSSRVSSSARWPCWTGVRGQRPRSRSSRPCCSRSTELVG